jgi:hypothetical protein
MKNKTIYISTIVATMFVMALIIWKNNIYNTSSNSENYKSKQVICKTRSELQIDIVAARLMLLDDMKKSEHNYDLKVPIEFYGKVLDQHENPVPGAEIQLGLNSIDGITNTITHSRQDGSFSLSGVKGKFLSVNVFGREGYAGVHSTGYRDYNYAIPGEFNFHVPNPKSPVIFKIWKYEHPEPLHRKSIEAEMQINGTIAWVNINNGKPITYDIGFAYIDSAHTKDKARMPEIRVVAGDECKIWETKDDPMFSPPGTGGEKELVHEFVSMNEEYRDASGRLIQGSPFKFRFYCRTATGIYAAIEADIRYESEEKQVVTLHILLNPSGSRNLEYDPRMQINEK